MSSVYGIPKRADLNTCTIVLDTHAGYGSTNTKVPYFTNIQSTSSRGLSIVSNDSVSGLGIQATETVMVAVTYTTQPQTSNGLIVGLSVDSVDLTTSIFSISDGLTARKAMSRVDGISGGKPVSNVCWVGVMYAGQVLRPHTDGSVSSDVATCKFEVTVISR